MSRTLQGAWLCGLTAVVAMLYVWVGLAAHGPDRALGLLGAVAIMAAVAAARRSRPAAIALLLLGALPLAVFTWWSIVTPVLAALCLLVGWPRTWPARSLSTSQPAVAAAVRMPCQ